MWSMSKRLVDHDHLRRVVSLPCMMLRAGFYTHSKTIQAHHLLKPSDGRRGLSLKSGDDQVIPLCHHCHAQLHTKYGSEAAFFKARGMAPDAGQKYAKELYEKTLWERENPSDLPF